MKKILLTVFSVLVYAVSYAQLLTWTPNFPTDNSSITITVDAKGRVTSASTPSVNVTGVTFANVNASGTASGSFAHAPNQKIYISSSAPNSDSIGNNGDIWYQTLT